MSAPRTTLLAVAAAASVWFVGRTGVAAPAPMTRTQIIDLAKTGVGYSYWWGHGGWRADGVDPGTCSGSCPSCDHTGSYGADCSGFAGKVWQIPSPSALDDDQHPYSTVSFRNDFTHWSQIDWSEVKMADAFVRNDGSAGHIFVYESGDPWGSVWAYECRSCTQGCVHNLRTITTDYIAIRRDLVEDDPVVGEDAGPEAAPPLPDAEPDVADEPPAVEEAGEPDQEAPDASEPEAPTDPGGATDNTTVSTASETSGLDSDANCACRAAGDGSARRGAGRAALLLLAAGARLTRTRRRTGS